MNFSEIIERIDKERFNIYIESETKEFLWNEYASILLDKENFDRMFLLQSVKYKNLYFEFSPTISGDYNFECIYCDKDLRDFDSYHVNDFIDDSCIIYDSHLYEKFHDSDVYMFILKNVNYFFTDGKRVYGLESEIFFSMDA